MRGTYFSDNIRSSLELEREPMSDRRFDALVRLGYFAVTVAGLIAALVIGGPFAFILAMFIAFIAGAIMSERA